MLCPDAASETAEPSPPNGREAQGKPLGRPRRISLVQVIDAALEIGLQTVTLTAVAERLGVRPATLYTYVDSREALVRLAAERKLQRRRLDDHGQPWSEVVRAHAEGSHQMFSDEPQLLVHFINGGFGPGDEMDYLERFLALLVARGFTPVQALRVYRLSSQIALGAASERAHADGAARSGSAHAELARTQFRERPGDYPHLSACAELYLSEQRHFGFQETLEQFLAGVAAERGEPRPLMSTI